MLKFGYCYAKIDVESTDTRIDEVTPIALVTILPHSLSNLRVIRCNGRKPAEIGKIVFFLS